MITKKHLERLRTIIKANWQPERKAIEKFLAEVEHILCIVPALLDTIEKQNEALEAVKSDYDYSGVSRKDLDDHSSKHSSTYYKVVNAILRETP